MQAQKFGWLVPKRDMACPPSGAVTAIHGKDGGNGYIADRLQNWRQKRPSRLAILKDKKCDDLLLTVRPATLVFKRAETFTRLSSNGRREKQAVLFFRSAPLLLPKRYSPVALLFPGHFFEFSLEAAPLSLVHFPLAINCHSGVVLRE